MAIIFQENTCTAKISGIDVPKILCMAANLFLTLEHFYICELFMLCWEYIHIRFIDI